MNNKRPGDGQHHMQNNNHNYHNFPNNHRNYHNNYDNRDGNGRRDGHYPGNNYDRNNQHHRNDYSNGGGGRVRRDSEAEWDDWERKRELDEYSGLMTPKQKGWLRNIQTMQLQTDNPYRDDYYFVMTRAKKNRPHPDAPLQIDGLNRILPVLPEPGKENEKTYTPPAMENSLGKLQVASVNAPRKILDVSAVRTSTKSTTEDQSGRSYRELLLFLEKLYGNLMELEDLDRKAAYLPDSPTRDGFMKEARTLANRMWQSITRSQEDFVRILCVSKGITLVGIMANRLGAAATKDMVKTVLANLPKLTSSMPVTNTGHSLNLLWPVTDRLLADASSELLFELAEALLPHLEKTPGNETDQMNPILSTKFGITVVMGLLVCGEHIHTEVITHKIWQTFLSKVISLLGNIPNWGKITGILVRDNEDNALVSSSPTSMPAPAVTVLSRGQSLSSLKQQNAQSTSTTPTLAAVSAAATPTPQPSAHLARCTQEIQSSTLAAAQSALEKLGTDGRIMPSTS